MKYFHVLTVLNVRWTMKNIIFANSMIRFLLIKLKNSVYLITDCIFKRLWIYTNSEKIFYWIKKLFVWKTFFDLKKCFILMEQNLFDSNKISLDKINILSNQINFCLESNKLYLWPHINALISLFWRKINLIRTNIYLVQRYFVWIKQILFHLNKSFL